MKEYNLCIIKPNKSAFSETFIQEHINRLSGQKKVLYGGAFPVYDDAGNYLIKSKLGLLWYLIEKRVLKRKDIAVRNAALVRYLKRENIEIVLAEFGMVGGMVAKACEVAEVPLVMHFFGADAHHKKTVSDYLPFYQRAFRYSSRIVVVSNDIKEALVKLGAPGEKIEVIPCGADVNKFSSIKITNSKRFLAVGRFVEKKSPLSLIRAFAKVLGEVPDAELIMVGDGQLLGAAENLVTELKLQSRVKLVGVKTPEEIKELIKTAACFVQHSVTADDGDKEGTPVSILEASASGLPVVSTLHAGIKEAVLDGVSGYLVAELDIEGMAASMIKIANSDINELTAMGAAGRAHIFENYDLEKQISKLDAVIKSSTK